MMLTDTTHLYSRLKINSPLRIRAPREPTGEEGPFQVHNWYVKAAKRKEYLATKLAAKRKRVREETHKGSSSNKPMLEGVQAPSLPQARVAEDSIDAIVFDIAVHEFMAKAGEYCQEVSKLSPSLGLCRLPALLHLRMFSLFGQLCRLRNGDNILARHAMNIFSSANSSSKSWFW